MKANLLFLLACILWLPTSYAQLLTEIRDSTIDTNIKDFDSDGYLAIGHTARFNLGYRQMRDFYKTQGFDYFNLQDFASIAAGLRFKENYYVSLGVDLSFQSNSPDDIELFNDHILSLHERNAAVHLLLGYRFWQKRHQSLIFHVGASFLQNRAEIVERRPQDFDFTTANINVPEGVRSWPVFIHRQGAIHVALQVKLSYPRQRWLSTDAEMKIGFVSGLTTKQWTTEPGQATNTPIGRAQYIYISGLYHFFSRQKQLRR